LLLLNPNSEIPGSRLEMYRCSQAMNGASRTWSRCGRTGKEPLARAARAPLCGSTDVLLQSQHAARKLPKLVARAPSSSSPPQHTITTPQCRSRTDRQRCCPLPYGAASSKTHESMPCSSPELPLSQPARQYSSTTHPPAHTRYSPEASRARQEPSSAPALASSVLEAAPSGLCRPHISNDLPSPPTRSSASSHNKQPGSSSAWASSTASSNPV